MADEITGKLSMVSYTLEVQVPVLTVGATAAGDDAPTVTVAERVHVPGMLAYYEQFLWERPGGMRREQFKTMLEDYIRLAILHQVGVETTPLVVTAAPAAEQSPEPHAE